MLREYVGERGRLPLLPGISADLPTVDVDGIAVKEGHALELPREPVHPPELFAGFQRVCRDPVGARNDHLRLAVRRPEHSRGAVAPRAGRALGLPHRLARFGVESEQVGSHLLVADDQQLPVGQNRRRAVAVLVDERTERVSPALIALGVEGNHTEIAEEHVDVLAVRHW